ncbi:MAG: hypothetical protein U5L96_07305 [Owenweeksia sp.]|nr:hypothetical protein [Owenweeksia sp.]
MGKKDQLNWRFNLPAIAREVAKTGSGLADRAIFYGPTLFIRGGASWYIQGEDWEGITNHFPEAKLITIEGAGHWLHAEKPREFFREVNQFLME